MTVSSKVRIYDLAKELKLDTKRLIEEVRREGVDVSVPSNSVSKELAEKIRNKYFPKKETTVKRAVKVVKRAVLPVAETPVVEADPEAVEPEVVEPPVETPVEVPVAPAPPAPKPATTARLVKKLTPATRAEQPAPEVILEPEPAIVEPPAEPEIEEKPVAATEAPVPAPVPELKPATPSAPSRQ